MIHLVTDSATSPPPEVRAKYPIQTISLKIIVGDRTYDEEGGIALDEFYRLLSQVSTAPTTSQPSAGEFLALFEPLVADPQDEVIAILISAELSGTIPNARAAAKELAPERIHIVDSRTASIGTLLMVDAAAEALAAGKSRAAVVAMVEQMVEQSCAYFMVENLEYLHKGGRINTATRYLGTLLNIKPILYIAEGKIQSLDKTRTSRRARERVLDEVVGYVGDQAVRVAVGHIQAPDAAAELAEGVRERLNAVALYTSEVMPVIGTHVGPGFSGVAACPVIEP